MFPSPIRATLLALLALLASAAPAAADTIHVDRAATGGAGCGTQANPCKTVQEGVDAAAADDTVQVAAGTYEEQVDIAKPISVVGAGIGQTVILSPPAAQMQDKFDFTSTFVEHPIVYVHDTTTVNISNLTVDGANRGGVPCDGFYAIAYVRAGGSVSLVRATGITSTPFSGCQTGRAIVNYNFDGQPRTWSLTNSLVDDFQKGGIEVRNNNLTSTIASNLVLGRGAQNQIAQNGIVVRNQAFVQGNTVQDLLCNEPSCGPNVLTQASSTGVLLGAGSGGAELDANTITNTDVAVSNGGSAPGQVGLKSIHDNTLADNRYAGIFSYDGTLTLNRNTISGSDTAIFAESFENGATDYIATVNGASNNITGNDIGIRIYENAPGADDPVISLNHNRIVGNGVGATSSSSGSADLQRNWWGCNAGPTEAGCDNVAGTVDYNPWLVLTLDPTPSSILANQTSDLTAAVFTDSNDNVTATLFPDGIPITFGSSFGSVATGSDPTGAAQSESVFDPQGQTGPATVSATLDNQTVNRTVTVSAVPLPDTDNDGVPDSTDACPNQAGSPANNGCLPPPADSDGDNVPDDTDACPNVAGTVANAGCPPPSPPPGDCESLRLGRPQADVLIGTPFGDRIRALAGDDHVYGRAGSDCLNGGPGRDLLRGEGGGDKARGGRGRDRVLGGRGSDVLRGGRLNDLVKGGSGADTLWGGSGNDALRGGSGNDTIWSRGRTFDRVACGKGHDVVRADSHDRVAGDCERVIRR